MLRISSLYSLYALLISACLAFLSVQAQNTSAYPDWVSNDYNCVIGCMQVFNSSMTTIPNPPLEASAMQCVTSTCDSSTTVGNLYQANYILQMFYATGSIYESTSSSSADGPTSTDDSQSPSTTANNDIAVTSDSSTSTNTDNSGSSSDSSPTSAAGTVSIPGVTGALTTSVTSKASGSSTASASSSSSSGNSAGRIGVMGTGVWGVDVLVKVSGVLLGVLMGGAGVLMV